MSNKKIKVLKLIPWYPDKNDKYNPSRGTFFQEQFTSLSHFVDITVIIINLNYISKTKKIQDFWSIEQIREKDFNVYRLNAINIPKCYKCTAKYISLLLSNKLSKLVYNCDLIHSHVIFPSGAVGNELSKKFKKPHIITEHVSSFDRLLTSKYLNQVLLDNNYFTAVSGYLQNKIFSYGRLQCEVIPNYINTKKYYFKKNTNPITRIIHVSSMADVKNTDKLLFGFKLLLEKNNVDIELTMIGGGINVEKYQQIAKDLNINDVVKFVGDVDNVTLREYMSISDALIITSTIETFSVVGIEALASGIPVITTKCGGPEDYITESTGLFINSISPIEIAKGLEMFLKNKDQFESDEIQEYCFQNFDVINVSKKIINMYYELLEK